MPTDDPEPRASSRVSRGRLHRSGRQLLRLGTLLTVLSLVVALVAGWATRSLLDHLQSNSAELVDGSATVTLSQGDERTLYVTGGLIAPGELVPTPVDQISCTVTGPSGQVPFESLAAQGKRVGVDTALARLQVVGTFSAEESGEHELSCDGLGVVVAPEIGPASAIARIGGLVLGSLGTFLGLTMMLIGGALLLFTRGGAEPEEDVDDTAAPPAEGADEWWEDEADPHARSVSQADAADAGPGVAGGADASVEQVYAGLSDEDYVDVSEEELAAMSDEQIRELVDSGALVFVDDDGPVDQPADDADHDPGSTYR